jgi:hypothetical protein
LNWLAEMSTKITNLICDQAFQKISAGQQDNEFDLEGHAAKAKELLDQASQQLHLSAVAANKEHKSPQ